jgi:hypothetical protein
MDENNGIYVMFWLAMLLSFASIGISVFILVRSHIVNKSINSSLMEIKAKIGGFVRQLNNTNAVEDIVDRQQQYSIDKLNASVI